MEICQSLGSKVGHILLFLSIFLLLRYAKAENKTDPTDNVNLTPFEGWRSAYYCLQNISQSCPEKYVLTGEGWLNVTHGDGEEFCKAGCADHTRAVLTCIYLVKRDYWFANNATVWDLNETINRGCNASIGFNGVSLYPTSGYQKRSASILSAMSALAFVALFYM